MENLVKPVITKEQIEGVLGAVFLAIESCTYISPKIEAVLAIESIIKTLQEAGWEVKCDWPIG